MGEQVKVPRFDLMPLSQLQAIFRTTGIDVFSPMVTMPERLGAWAFFVRKPNEPNLTMAEVLNTMTMDDFDLAEDQEPAQPDPTNAYGQHWPTPINAVPLP